MHVARGSLARAGRRRRAARLAAEGLVLGTAGNVSARAASGSRSRRPARVLGELDPEQVAVVDLDGEVVDGELEPTSELDLHLGVYRRYDAGAVVHTHAPMATALSCVDRRAALRPLPDAAPRRHRAGRAVRDVRHPGAGRRRCSTRSTGRTAALMANHGAITYAADVERRSSGRCCSSGRAPSTGARAAIGEPRALDEDAARAVVEAVVERGYGTTGARRP